MLGHAHTVLGSLLPYVGEEAPDRVTIETPDGDFLDIDCYTPLAPLKGIAVVSHGLEGSAKSTYILRISEVLTELGWGVVAWNMRGCSGRPNRTPRSYHSGLTADLATVLEWVRGSHVDLPIALIGFSVGGNITLKYLGEQQYKINADIVGAYVFSVPCDIAECVRFMNTGVRRWYEAHFMKRLRAKIEVKRRIFPGDFAEDYWDGVACFRSYDERYTAPWFGFANADCYWKSASSRPYIPLIRVPTLIVNAKNDPFFPYSSNPFAEVRDNPLVRIEVPSSGGHNGFFSGMGWLVSKLIRSELTRL